MNVSALDESGRPVDWWFIYKVPQLSAGANNDSASGYEYVYYDPAIDATKGGHGRQVALPSRLRQGRVEPGARFRLTSGDMEQQKPAVSKTFVVRLWLLAEAGVILCAGLMLASDEFSVDQVVIMFALGTAVLLFFLGLCFGILSGDRKLLRKVYPVLWAVVSLVLLAKMLILMFGKK